MQVGTEAAAAIELDGAIMFGGPIALWALGGIMMHVGAEAADDATLLGGAVELGGSMLLGGGIMFGAALGGSMLLGGGIMLLEGGIMLLAGGIMLLGGGIMLGGSIEDGGRAALLGGGTVLEALGATTELVLEAERSAELEPTMLTLGGRVTLGGAAMDNPDPAGGK